MQRITIEFDDSRPGQASYLTESLREELAVMGLSALEVRMRTLDSEPDGPDRVSVDPGPELFYGLTIVCGEPGNVTVAAQLRTDGRLTPGADALALHLGPAAVRSSEDGHPAILSLEDTRKLRDLLNVATARGYL